MELKESDRNLCYVFCASRNVSLAIFNMEICWNDIDKRNIIFIIVQGDETLYSLFIAANCSTCFGR